MLKKTYLYNHENSTDVLWMKSNSYTFQIFELKKIQNGGQNSHQIKLIYLPCPHFLT